MHNIILIASTCFVILTLLIFQPGVDFAAWKLPAGANVKKVLGIILDHRYTGFGYRLTAEFVAAIGEDGTIDFSVAGIHKLSSMTSGTTAPLNAVRSKFWSPSRFREASRLLRAR